MDTVAASTQRPLNMIARCMFCGGFASVEARRAFCAVEKGKRRKGHLSNEERATKDAEAYII